jgi:hypothetical protein
VELWHGGKDAADGHVDSVLCRCFQSTAHSRLCFLTSKSSPSCSANKQELMETVLPYQPAVSLGVLLGSHQVATEGSTAPVLRRRSHLIFQVALQ